MPWFLRIERNSKVSISKPIEASMTSKARSAILAKSIILLISFGHSTNVILVDLLVRIVTVPFITLTFCFV